MVLQVEEFRLIPCASPASGRKSKTAAGSMHEPSRFQCQDAAGEIVRLRAIGSFTLSEHLYPAGMVLPKRAHRDVYFTFVLEGSFREKSAGGTLVCRPGTIRFLPADEVHEDVI